MSVSNAYRGKGENIIAIEYYTKFLSIYYLNDIEGIEQYTILRNYAFACGSIADLYCDIEMHEESIKYFKMAIQDLESYGDFFLYIIAHDYSKLGHVYLKIKDYDNAIENFEKCLISWHQNLKKENYINDEDIINTYHLLGIAYSNTQNPDNALYNYEKALFLDKDCNGDNTARKGHIYSNMGDLYKHEQRHKKALKYYSKALSIYREHYPADSPIIKNLLNTIIFG